jgi:hypothetical protein
MHVGQTNTAAGHAHRIPAACVAGTRRSSVARPKLDIGVLESHTLGYARRRVGVAVAPTNRHMVRRAVARQAGERAVADARDLALFFRARYLPGVAAADVALDVKPGAVVDAASAQRTRTVREAGQRLALFQVAGRATTTNVEATLLVR